MTRLSVKYDEVVKVIKKLEKQNKKVSAISVRTLLNRGSLTTILNYIRQYRTETQTLDKMPVTKQHPTAYKKGYNDAIRDITKQLKALKIK